jgi:Xaa-Pro aminopeptidase
MRRTLPLVLVVTVAFSIWGLDPVAGQMPPFGGAREYAIDLAARRAKAMAALGPDTVLVMWSAPSRVYSGDTNYEYRQESNFLYLTGVAQEQSILVLVPGARTRKEFLFVREGDQQRELWNGHILTPAEVTARSGIADVYTQRGTDVFDAFMAALLAGSGYGLTQEGADQEFGPFLAHLREGRAKLSVLARLSGSDSDGGLGRDAEANAAWARVMEGKHPGVTAVSAGRTLMTQRQIKTPYEQALLRRSVAISAEAHVEGMKATRPGRWEYEVEAAIEHWFLKNGALSWGYPSIVGSGPNATTLHYNASDRQMKSGDLLLVDAAGNYQGLTGDITRTYPVSGRFSTEQRAIYDLVLRAQEAGIAAARPGGKVDDIVRAVRAVFGEGLEALGLVSRTTGPDLEQQISLWFPHGPTHGIGVDVHDPLGVLDPGAAFVIEPGLYIRSDTFARLPKSPATAAFIEKVTPALEKYRDIGVRVEDSFVMTPSGPEMLSGKAPRRTEDIEAVVGKGP